MSASSYANLQSRIETPRETEIRAFRYVNGLLKTHQLWSILLAELTNPDNKLPVELRARLVSLGLWAQREALARLSDDRGVEPLMALHRDMIEALEAQASAPAAPAPGAGFSVLSA
jgi:flagellar protein FlaF